MRLTDPVNNGLSRPVAVGVTVLALGFGVMSVLAVVGNTHDDLPGHWDYLSGTWGDALLLPLLGSSLLWLVLNLPESRFDARAVGYGALVGMGGGVAVQASWLADSDPELNWMLVAPHTFSLPGWYHAGFLIVVASGYSALGFLAIVRLRFAKETAKFHQAVLLITASVSAFITLVIADSLRTAWTKSSGTTITVSIVVLLAAVSCFCLASRSARMSIPTLAGSLLGLSVGAAIIAFA